MFNSTVFNGAQFNSSGQLTYTVTVQTLRKNAQLLATACQSSRRTALAASYNWQSLRLTATAWQTTAQTRRRLDVYVQNLYSAQLVRWLTCGGVQATAQTLRKLTELRSTVQQTSRRQAAGYSTTQQSKRTVILQFVLVGQSSRNLTQLYQGGVATMRLLQDSRAVLSRQQEALLRMLVSVKYIGTVEILDGAISADLEPVIVMPSETKVFAFTLKNSSGRQLSSLSIAMGQGPAATEEYVARRMVGVTNSGVDQSRARIWVGTDLNDLKQLVGYNPVLLKPDAMQNNEQLTIYLKISQPQDILPITKLPFEITFEVV